MRRKLAFVFMKVKALRRSKKAVAKLKFILDRHLVAGDFDYFLKNQGR
jgi:hypothetical protein